MPPKPPQRRAPGNPGAGAPRRRIYFGWAEAMVLVGVITLAMGAFVAMYVVRQASTVGTAAVEATGEAVERVARSAVDLAQAFRQGTITSTFFSYATEVSGSSFLQFATLEQTEVFERKDSASVLWGQLDLPDVVVEARAPVQYTYYLDLAKEWQFDLRGDDLLVRAPPIEFNRPAVDTSALAFEVREDSVLRDTDDAVAKLRANITPMLHRRARKNVDLVREIGRRRTEEFVKNWLLRDFGSEAEDLDVEVLFPDEGEPAAKPGLQLSQPPQI